VISVKHILTREARDAAGQRSLQQSGQEGPIQKYRDFCGDYSVCRLSSNTDQEE